MTRSAHSPVRTCLSNLLKEQDLLEATAIEAAELLTEAQARVIELYRDRRWSPAALAAWVEFDETAFPVVNAQSFADPASNGLCLLKTP